MRLDTAAITIVEVSLYHIASKYDVSVTELLAELDLDLSPEVLEEIGTGIVKLAFTQAALTLATGGLGTALKVVYELSNAKDSLETFKSALALYKIAFPNGVLADLIGDDGSARELGKGDQFARDHIKSNPILQAFFGVDFAQFDGATTIVVAADSAAERPGQLVTKGSDGIDILWGRGGARIDGGKGSDLLFHTGYGEVQGGEGNDILISQTGQYVATGTLLNPKVAPELDANDNPVAGPNSNFVFASQDQQQILDGGAGNDIVLSLNSGDRVVTLGGTGRDWIYNTSAGGIVYGDTVDGIDPLTGQKVTDSKANADNFWFAADTVIMDAQHHDVLKYFGLTLTGGDAAASGAALVLGGLAGGLAGASAALAASSLAGLGNRVYFDHLLPFITYKFVAGDEGRTDLIVGNVMDDLFGGYLGKGRLLGPLTPDGAPASGVLRVKNFDVIGSTFGSQQAALGAGVNGGAPLGTLNLVFKKGVRARASGGCARGVAPIAAALGVVGWLLPGGIGIAFQALALADAAQGIAAAASRFAKGLKWAEGSDPLVIDLDGDGIETLSQGVSKAYFDVDGDLFRERAKVALQREVSEVDESAAQHAPGSSAQSIVENSRAVAVWRRNLLTSGSHRFSTKGAANDDDALFAREAA